MQEGKKFKKPEYEEVFNALNKLAIPLEVRFDIIKNVEPLFLESDAEDFKGEKYCIDADRCKYHTFDYLEYICGTVILARKLIVKQRRMISELEVRVTTLERNVRM